MGIAFVYPSKISILSDSTGIKKKRLPELFRQSPPTVDIEKMAVLLGVIDCPLLSDNSYLDLAGIGQLTFNMFGNIVGELIRIAVAYLVGSYNNPELSSCLDGICLGYSFKGKSQLFQVSQTLDIGLHGFTAGTGSCPGDGITYLYHWSNQAGHLHFFVVRADGIGHFGLLLVFLGQFHTKHGMRKLGFVIGHLTNIVE